MAGQVVIVVPGITGSELRRSVFGGLFATIWLDPVLLLAGGFVRCRLAVPSESKPAPFLAVDLPGPALPYYYGTLGTYLAVRGWSIRYATCDWRYPLAQDAARLAEQIRSLATAGPVQLVAHSRGGLVTRAALGILAGTGQLAMVQRVIGLGVPHTGSMSAAAYVSGDNKETRLARELAELLPVGVSSALAVKTLTDVTRSWAALYELMPAPTAAWVTTFSPAALYDPATWTPSKTVPVTAYLTGALANWSAVPSPPAGVEWIDVAGVGVLTAYGSESLADLAESGSLADYQDGDGVVPLPSAAQRPRPRVLTPTGHSSLIIDPRVWDLCGQVLANGLSTDLAISGRILDI